MKKAAVTLTLMLFAAPAFAQVGGILDKAILAQSA
jgi:hypothetical protein